MTSISVKKSSECMVTLQCSSNYYPCSAHLGHVPASLHFNENLQRKTKKTKGGKSYITGLSKQAGSRRSSGGCYEVYRRLLCFATLIIFKQVKNDNSTKLLCFSLFSPP